MIPVCRNVIEYGGGVFAEGIGVSVTLVNKSEPLLGRIVEIDESGFALDMSTENEACVEWIYFSWIENIIKRQDKDYELRYAAKVVRNEFLKQGDWYNALVKSITGYLIETQGNAKICDIAEGLAKRLIGDERDGTD